MNERVCPYLTKAAFACKRQKPLLLRMLFLKTVNIFYCMSGFYFNCAVMYPGQNNEFVGENMAS